MTISASSLPRVPEFGRPARIPVRHSTRARARRSGHALPILAAELLQLAALKAGVLGCKAFMLHRPWASADPISVAQSIGQVSRASDYLRIDIADYADAGCRSAKRDF